MTGSFHREGGHTPPSLIRHPLSEAPLPYRQLLDCGVRSYDELACSRSTLSWLQATWSDVALQVVEQCPGGHNVIVKAWPKEETHEAR